MLQQEQQQQHAVEGLQGPHQQRPAVAGSVSRGAVPVPCQTLWRIPLLHPHSPREYLCRCWGPPRLCRASRGAPPVAGEETRGKVTSGLFPRGEISEANRTEERGNRKHTTPQRDP